MQALTDNLMIYFGVFWDYFRIIIDIILVSFLLYWGYRFLSNTRAIQLLKGVFLIVFFAVLSKLLKLDTLNWLLDKFATSLVILVVIIFQPELRRLITQFGQRNWIASESKEILPLDELVSAIFSMAAEKVGSIIVIERNTGLKSYVESGIAVDSNITEEIIRTIFYPFTPLHDGAIIIHAGRIASAACYLPLSDSKQLRKHHGARHRAALGIAEETDALVLVTSEESGNISIMVNGKIHPRIKAADLKNMILFFMNPKTANEEKYKLA
ncbi:diadenylate cyclase CdaA [Spirochaetota bacterium]